MAAVVDVSGVFWPFVRTVLAAPDHDAIAATAEYAALAEAVEGGGGLAIARARLLQRGEGGERGDVLVFDDVNALFEGAVEALASDPGSLLLAEHVRRCLARMRRTVEGMCAAEDLAASVALLGFSKRK